MILKRMDKCSVKSILLVSLSNLGDMVLTTPVFMKLAGEFPDAVIDVFCGAPGGEIFSRHPAVREVIIARFHRSAVKRLKNLIYLRNRHYDLVVDLKKTLLPLFVGAAFHPPVFSFSGYSRVSGIKKTFHKKEEHLRALRSLGINTDDADFFVPVTMSDCRAVDDLLKGPGGGDIVLLNPGAKSHLKRWGAGKYAELADRLTGELGCRIMIAGNEDDKGVIGDLLDSVNVPVENIGSRTTIGELMELMRRVSLVITNDSAPLHMASAVNAPTVAIFGPTDERKYGPLADKNRVIKPSIKCRPCGKALCSIGPDEGCISRITVGEVFNAAKEILGA